MKKDVIVQRIKIAARYAAPALIVVGVLALMVAVRTALALDAPRDLPTTPKTLNSLQEFFDFLRTLVKWLLVFSLLIGVGAIIYGGITYVTAGGNTERAGKGSHIIGYALLGIAVMVLAFTLVSVVANIVGGDVSGVVGG